MWASPDRAMGTAFQVEGMAWKRHCKVQSVIMVVVLAWGWGLQRQMSGTQKYKQRRKKGRNLCIRFKGPSIFIHSRNPCCALAQASLCLLRKGPCKGEVRYSKMYAQVPG